MKLLDVTLLRSNRDNFIFWHRLQNPVCKQCLVNRILETRVTIFQWQHQINLQDLM